MEIAVADRRRDDMLKSYQERIERREEIALLVISALIPLATLHGLFF